LNTSNVDELEQIQAASFNAAASK